MPLMKFDLIQRFEVENDVPRLVSTNIQVIEGGIDLMSCATSMLAVHGFSEVFEQNRTSQYTGYRYKNSGKGAKRYQLILAQRKEGLDISLPQNVLAPYLLELKWIEALDDEINDSASELLWVLPSKEDKFLEISRHMGLTKVLDGQSVGVFDLDEGFFYINPRDYIKRLNEEKCCLQIRYDKLFPYTWQVNITSKEVLEEFIDCFAKILIKN